MITGLEATGALTGSDRWTAWFHEMTVFTAAGS